MATKRTHIHRGTCQACGAIQAVDNTTGLLAKHGYQVAGFGFFNGVCRGAGYLPAEKDVTVTHRIITDLTEWAADADRLAGLWADGTLMVVTHERSQRHTVYGRVAINVMMWGCSQYAIDEQRDSEVRHQQRQADQARSHIKFLKRDVLTRLGKDLYPTKPAPITFCTGLVVKFGDTTVTLAEPVYNYHQHVRGFKYTTKDGAHSGKMWASLYDLRKANKS